MLENIYIIKRIKEGDIKVFESVFKRFYAPLLAYSSSIVVDRDAAEEIVQELFYILWKDRKELDIRYSIKSYLYKAVRNRSLHYLEHATVRGNYIQKGLVGNDNREDQTPQRIMEYEELQSLIDRTMEKLPQRRLVIFKKHRFEGMKYKDIALELSLSVKTVEAEMSKAYHTLRKVVEEYNYRVK